MKATLSWLLVVVLLALGCSAAPLVTDLFSDNTNVVIRWVHLHYEIIGTAGYPLSPPMSARANAILNSAIYDTWSHYDRVALPSLDYTTNKVGGSPSQSDITQAISVAAWKTIKYIYKDIANSAVVASRADALLLAITGLSNPTTASTSPAVVLGLTVASQLLAFRDNDGANSLGNRPYTLATATGAVAYQDYTNYSPVNKPSFTNVAKTRESCASIDVNKWEPLTEPLAAGGFGTRRYASPQMFNVIPFGLDYPSQFRPPGPPVNNTNCAGAGCQWADQHNEVLAYSANLGDREKVIAEFWAPVRQFGNPPNMFQLFAMNTLITLHANIKESAQLLFALGNAAMDAGIASWDAKRSFDSSRPITGIRCLHAGQPTLAWAGPYQGVQTIDGGAWKPYQSIFQLTPPFSEYVSGHSTFSTAAAYILEQFYGSPNFIGPNSVTFGPGETTVEPVISSSSAPGYIAGVTNVPNSGPGTFGYSPAAPVTLSWATWAQAADEAGISRLYGGIHIRAGNLHGGVLGRQVGQAVWEKASALFSGNGSVSSESSSTSSSSDEDN